MSPPETRSSGVRRSVIRESAMNIYRVTKHLMRLHNFRRHLLSVQMTLSLGIHVNGSATNTARLCHSQLIGSGGCCFSAFVSRETASFQPSSKRSVFSTGSATEAASLPRFLPSKSARHAVTASGILPGTYVRANKAASGARWVLTRRSTQAAGLPSCSREANARLF